MKDPEVDKLVSELSEHTAATSRATDAHAAADKDLLHGAEKLHAAKTAEETKVKTAADTIADLEADKSVLMSNLAKAVEFIKSQRSKLEGQTAAKMSIIQKIAIAMLLAIGLGSFGLGGGVLFSNWANSSTTQVASVAGDEQARLALAVAVIKHFDDRAAVDDKHHADVLARLDKINDEDTKVSAIFMERFGGVEKNVASIKASLNEHVKAKTSAAGPPADPLASWATDPPAKRYATLINICPNSDVWAKRPDVDAGMVQKALALPKYDDMAQTRELVSKCKILELVADASEVAAAEKKTQVAVVAPPVRVPTQVATISPQVPSSTPAERCLSRGGKIELGVCKPFHRF